MGQKRKNAGAKQKREIKKWLRRIALCTLLCIVWIVCIHAVYEWMYAPLNEQVIEETSGSVTELESETTPEIKSEAEAQPADSVIFLSPQETAEAGPGINLQDVPAYMGEPFTVINDNVPFFTEEEMNPEAYEYYSPLDELGRCSVCVAGVGIETMPTEDRGSIGSVKPTGWVNNKYPGVVDGSYLYNRCHLIGFQLTGENANKGNLITGTRYINVEGMLPFENMVADFVKETGYHVIYRITPVFDGDDLLAHGVLMEAKSVEDDGEGILFNVYCYNVQPGIEIDYATGENKLAD